MLSRYVAQPDQRCDVLIAGGGPAGLAAAIALAERHVHFMLVDPTPVPFAPSRCEMLPGSALAILGRLGISPVLSQAVALEGIKSLWDTRAGKAGAVRHFDTYGWSIDRSVVLTRLRERAEALGADLQRSRVGRITGSADDWRVTLLGPSGETTTACRYLIDATGRPALLARRLGAHVEFGPRHIALVAETSLDLPPYLLAEAAVNGWWYALPRHGGGSTIGFLTGGIPARRAAFELSDFLLLQTKSLRMIARPVQVESLTLCDSRSARLSSPVGTGWLTAGDAAAAFDPIASQGLFNALSSGFFAGNAAADNLLGNADAGEIYADLVVRTAARTHRATPTQYAPHARTSVFWKARTENHFQQ